jgi:hypothetical protein
VTDLLQTARELSRVLEPFVGCVYFAPETHQSYVDLGFAASARSLNGVAMPDGVAYFTSRGSLLGQVHGNIVASAFAVFNPAAVVPAVAAGWQRTDALTIRAARQDGTIQFLKRVLSDQATDMVTVADALSRAVDTCSVVGRPLFAGVMSQPIPNDPLTRCWFLGDALREFRGDSHTAAWVSEGLSAIEIGLLTELWWGLPLKSYVRTRAWTEQDLDAGITSLEQRGYIADGAFTEIGRALRSSIEQRTDQQLAVAVDGLGSDVDSVIATLDHWSAQVREHRGYPATGPQDLVAAATSQPAAPKRGA